MAGSKTAKKKKSSAADSPELKAVQAWVAEGLKASGSGDLASHVGRDCQDTTPRLQLLGRLYLLLKRWPSEGASDEQMQQLQELLKQAVAEYEALEATGQKPSLVLVWTAVQACSKLAAGHKAGGDSDQQLQWCKYIINSVQHTLKALEAQPWLEQWQPPLDYPAAPEQDPAAKNPQRLAATLGTEMLLCYKDARMEAMRSGDPETPKQPTIKCLSSLIAGLEAVSVSAAHAASTHDSCCLAMHTAMVWGTTCCKQHTASAFPSKAGQAPPTPVLPAASAHASCIACHTAPTSLIACVSSCHVLAGGQGVSSPSSSSSKSRTQSQGRTQGQGSSSSRQEG